MFRLAGVWAERSTCSRKKTGAVIADARGYVISSGYNGSPPGLPHCEDVGCLILPGLAGCQRTNHAEMNAILYAARMGVAVEGANIFVTMRPCIRCTTAIIQAGICSITYLEDYATDNADDLVIDMCEQSGVSLKRFAMPEDV